MLEVAEFFPSVWALVSAAACSTDICFYSFLCPFWKNNNNCLSTMSSTPEKILPSAIVQESRLSSMWSFRKLLKNPSRLLCFWRRLSQSIRNQKLQEPKYEHMNALSFSSILYLKRFPPCIDMRLLNYIETSTS